jgi:phosphopantothenoylcysteine decarboxylase/phosphopantothenate--cysteine ligase
MNELNGKRILLGVTGGIAAYKAAELVRLLNKEGADVRVVMTNSGAEFISPLTLQALSGNPVHTSMWDQSIPNGMPHIELSRDCDLVLVAPATADFMAKLAAGRADDLVEHFVSCQRLSPDSRACNEQADVGKLIYTKKLGYLTARRCPFRRS